MLEEAILRAAPLVGEGHVLAATSRALREPFLASGLAADRILAEPNKRNTLGCLVWVSANLIARGQGQATVGVLTADHRIGDPELFRRNCTAAFEIAEQIGGIVTLGIRPTRAETGFGYIEVDFEATVSVPHGSGAKCVRFREKPDAETAQQFVNDGNYLWNAGMFFYTIPSFMTELSLSQPDAHGITLEIADHLREGNLSEAEAAFDRLPNISIDYAVMEKAKQVTVISADFEWDDVGSWDALDRTRVADSEGNVVEGDVVAVHSSNTIVLNQLEGITVGVVGLENVIVVATPDGVLICSKEHAQNVRSIPVKLNERSK